MGITLTRWPVTEDEMHAFVEVIWNIKIPRSNVCPNHAAPWDAFWYAYNATGPSCLWKASRGFGGKSTMLGHLTLTEGVVLAADGNVLGGSASQSLRVHEVVKEGFLGEFAPQNMLVKDPTRFETRLANGAVIRALLASQRSVRGPHPQRLRLDEIDEMELEILEASLGQPMDMSTQMMATRRVTTPVQAQTVMSSTHQYPDGTMTHMMRTARDNSWPIFEWCWKENLVSNNGWLTEREVELKRAIIPNHMWQAEYDLQEPAFEGRAIDNDDLKWMFGASGHVLGENMKSYIFEDPVDGAEYVTGVDWAKQVDHTVVRTFRTDVVPWREVCFMRGTRRPYKQTVSYVNNRMKMYPGVLVHDATGLGAVIDEYINVDTGESQVVPFIFTAASKTALFREFLSALESHAMQSPMIDWAMSEAQYCRLDDLFSSGSNFHPPDSIVAQALVWLGRSYRPRPTVAVSGVAEKHSYWRDSTPAGDDAVSAGVVSFGA